MAAREAPRQDLEAQLRREISSMIVAGQAIKNSIEEDHRRQVAALQEIISNLETKCADLTSECNSLKLQIQKANKARDEFREGWTKVNFAYNDMKKQREVMEKKNEKLEKDLGESERLAAERLGVLQACGRMAIDAVPAQQTPPPQIEALKNEPAASSSKKSRRE